MLSILTLRRVNFTYDERSADHDLHHIDRWRVSTVLPTPVRYSLERLLTISIVY